MSVSAKKTPVSTLGNLFSFFWLAVGACLSAVAVEIFLNPNDIVDGGIVGLSMMVAHLTKSPMSLPLALVALNAPFIFLALRSIGRSFVLRMMFAVFAFVVCFLFLPPDAHFVGDMLEVVVLGGICLGVGLGLIIRNGGCLDGTEILALIVQQRRGFTVGQVILFINFFIFLLSGFVYGDWHTPLKSLMTYFVATKIMDTVIVGFDETKSVDIICSKPRVIADALIHELGVGLTIMYGEGGYSKGKLEILHVVIERLQLSELKNIVAREDPSAFITVATLHEVVNGSHRIGKAP